MRALVCVDYGEGADLAIGELPVPRPQPGQIQVEVVAADVSYVDALMVRDKHQNKHELPFAPGMAVSGRVSALGEGVEHIRVGDRVMGLVYDGGLAEVASGMVTEMFVIPDELDHVTAAAMVGSYLTAHAALHWEALLEPGETVLVLGAAGGVGLAAVDVATALGARVIAGASTPEKTAIAAEKGAFATVCYGEEDVFEAVDRLTEGRGVDVVYDPVGGDVHESAFRCLGWGGRYVIVGFAGGKVPRFAANRLLVKNRKAVGFVLMYYRRHRTDRLAETARALCALQEAGAIRPSAHRVLPLEGAGAAIDDFYYRRAAGKTIVRLRAPQ